jgi:hypothetical protein
MSMRELLISSPPTPCNYPYRTLSLEDQGGVAIQVIELESVRAA